MARLIEVRGASNGAGGSAPPPASGAAQGAGRLHRPATTIRTADSAAAGIEPSTSRQRSTSPGSGSGDHDRPSRPPGHGSVRHGAGHRRRPAGLPDREERPRCQTGGAGSAERSKNAAITSAPDTPSMIEWCTLGTTARWPGSNPSTTWNSHRGRAVEGPRGHIGHQVGQFVQASRERGGWPAVRGSRGRTRGRRPWPDAAGRRGPRPCAVRNGGTRCRPGRPPCARMRRKSTPRHTGGIEDQGAQDVAGGWWVTPRPERPRPGRVGGPPAATAPSIRSHPGPVRSRPASPPPRSRPPRPAG